MSANRRACGAHQKEFFCDQHNRSLISTPVDNVTSLNHKTFHANHLYDRWFAKTTKRVFSNRLGVTYYRTPVNTDIEHVRSHPGSYMYRNLISGFHSTKSKIPKTKRKQEARFNRFSYQQT